MNKEATENRRNERESRRRRDATRVLAAVFGVDLPMTSRNDAKNSCQTIWHRGGYTGGHVSLSRPPFAILTITELWKR